MAESPFLRRVNKRDSGLHGRRSESLTAKRVKGVTQPGSGALDGAKGDIKKVTEDRKWLMENKATNGQSFTMKKEWLLKIYQEARETNCTPALSFQFTDDSGRSEVRERWIAVPEHIWLEITGD